MSLGSVEGRGPNKKEEFELKVVLEEESNVCSHLMNQLHPYRGH